MAKNSTVLPVTIGRSESTKEFADCLGRSLKKPEKKILNQFLQAVFRETRSSLWEASSDDRNIRLEHCVGTALDAVQARDHFLRLLELEKTEKQRKNLVEKEKAKHVAEIVPKAIVVSSKPKKQGDVVSSVAKAVDKTQIVKQSVVAKPSQKISGKAPFVTSDDFRAFLTTNQLTDGDREFYEATRAYQCPLHFSGNVFVMCRCGKGVGDMLNVPFEQVTGCCCPVVSDEEKTPVMVKRRVRHYSKSFVYVLPHVQKDGECCTRHPFGGLLRKLRDALPQLTAVCNEMFVTTNDYRVTNAILGGRFSSGFHAVLMYSVVAFQMQGAIVVPADDLKGIINQRVYDGMLREKREFDQSVGRAVAQYKRRDTLEKFVHSHFPVIGDLTVESMNAAMRTIPLQYFPIAAKRVAYVCPHMYSPSTVSDVADVDVNFLAETLQSFPAKVVMSEVYCRATAQQRARLRTVDAAFVEAGYQVLSPEKCHDGVRQMSQYLSTERVWKFNLGYRHGVTTDALMVRIHSLHFAKFGRRGEKSKFSLCGHAMSATSVAEMSEIYGNKYSHVQNHLADVYRTASRSEIADLMNYVACRLDMIVNSDPNSIQARYFDTSQKPVGAVVEFALQL